MNREARLDGFQQAITDMRQCSAERRQKLVFSCAMRGCGFDWKPSHRIPTYAKTGRCLERMWRDPGPEFVLGYKRGLLAGQRKEQVDLKHGPVDLFAPQEEKSVKVVKLTARMTKQLLSTSAW